jgi:putative DNA primase/helicase
MQTNKNAPTESQGAKVITETHYNTVQKLTISKEQISEFCQALFLNATKPGYVQLRCFQDDGKGTALTPWHAVVVDPNEDEPTAKLEAEAARVAQRAADHGRPVVFAPPVVLLNSRVKAEESNVSEGLALSVDLDQGNPKEALAKLESILGAQATSVDHSGGFVPDPETGEALQKLHAHWRLAEPTQTPDEHAKLKRARLLANHIVGGDTTNNPLVHPIRWPGSWHRKKEPILSTIQRIDFSSEIDLDDALQVLETAAAAIEKPDSQIRAIGDENKRKPASEYLALQDQIRTAEAYHVPLIRLASKRAANGTNERGILEELEALMNQSEGPRDERWQGHFDDLPRTVRGAMRFTPAIVEDLETGIEAVFDFLEATKPQTGWHIVPFGVDSDPDLSHDSLALDLSRAGFKNDARYVHGWGKWLFWSGSHWRVDDRLLHMTTTRDFLRAKAKKLTEWGEKKASTMDSLPKVEKLMKWVRENAKALRQASNVASVESMARSNSDLVATVEQFDNDLMLLGTPGGTVDLRTGELIPAERRHWITKHCAITPAEPGEEAPLWDAFLQRVFDGDNQLIEFLQRAAGYALTGHTTEHKLLFLYGTGRNGKSVFLNTLFDIMGDYSKRAPAQTFLDSNGERHPTDLAGLMGARLVAGSELPPGKAWNESIVKDLTGGDVITARFMRQDYFDYVPQFTLFIAGNHQPSFRGIDEAIRARVVLVPFTQTIPAAERDPELPHKLRAEWPNILRWMITGAVKWQEQGLNVPESVQAASDEYLESEDTLGEFISEHLDIVGMGSVKVADMFERFTQWQKDSGISPTWTKRAMSQALRERGFSSTKLNSTARGFKGVMLKPAPDYAHYNAWE